MRVWKRRPKPTEFWQDSSVQLFAYDALDVLRAVRDEVVDLVFLDPPFNLGKRYGSRRPSQDRIATDRYYAYLTEAIEETARILKPGGATYLYHIPESAIQLAPVLSQHLSFRHWIAIAMKNGFARGNKLYPAHYALLYFTKGHPESFQRPKIPPARCRKCHELVKDYGGYRRYIENGINLSDVWDDISPVRHRARKYRAANEIPMPIVERMVAISGVRDGLFLDPFMGSGASILAATAAGMRAVGSDADPDQIDIVVSRLTTRPQPEETDK